MESKNTGLSIEDKIQIALMVKAMMKEEKRSRSFLVIGSCSEKKLKNIVGMKMKKENSHFLHCKQRFTMLFEFA